MATDDADGARDDAMIATNLSPSHPFAFRLLADAEEALGHELQAMDALSNWARFNPELNTKIQKEKARLNEKIR